MQESRLQLPEESRLLFERLFPSGETLAERFIGFFFLNPGRLIPCGKDKIHVFLVRLNQPYINGPPHPTWDRPIKAFLLRARERWLGLVSNPVRGDALEVHLTDLGIAFGMGAISVQIGIQGMPTFDAEHGARWGVLILQTRFAIPDCSTVVTFTRRKRSFVFDNPLLFQRIGAGFWGGW